VLGAGATVARTVVDDFARASGWIVVADPTARPADRGLRAVEALLRVPGFGDAHRPDRWLRVGAVPTSRVLAAWLDEAPGILVDDVAGRWRDPSGRVEHRVVAEPSALLGAVAAQLAARAGPRDDWAARWREASDVAATAQDATLDGWTECAEPRVARDVVAALPSGARLVLGSSMPIRDVAWFAVPRPDVRVFANRGANGIDGLVSTAVGVALADAAPVVVLTGDLGLLHDGTGMLAANRLAVDLVVVVVDNDGGGIFSFLPQSELPGHFEALFGTPPGVDVAALAAAQGFAVRDVTTGARVGVAVRDALAARGRQVVRVATDRNRNLEHHRSVWTAVAAAVSDRTRPAPV
jgi:2-succinyl-5-enolpyruvyl-6-hydroxy-3-cyclohexene-1-carboxylate synthase